MEAARIEAVAARAEAASALPCTAVLPVRVAAGRDLFVCAFGADGEHVWLVVDEAGEGVRDEQVVREAVELAAICESAEEAAAVLAGADALAALERAGALAAAAGERQAASAVAAMREALSPALAEGGGIRVADPAYLDRIAELAAPVGDRFDYLKEVADGVSARLDGRPGEPLEALAEALWSAVRALARDGAPDRFREQLEGAMAAAAALADDVVEHYVGGLAEGPAAKEDG
jgi:hypothetical protein